MSSAAKTPTKRQASAGRTASRKTATKPTRTYVATVTIDGVSIRIARPARSPADAAKIREAVQGYYAARKG